jgi:sulfane dehydrogenase subunit SoxC
MFTSDPSASRYDLLTSPVGNSHVDVGLRPRPRRHRIATGQGFYEISGIAWSGRRQIRRVEVSIDGGDSWRESRLQEPILSKCLTRFRMPWNWEGSPALLQSRAIDETGYVQPTREQLVAVRGLNSFYHYNAIQTWLVAQDGAVSNVT